MCFVHDTLNSISNSSLLFVHSTIYQPSNKQQLIRLNDDDIIRRTRGADTARSTSVMRAYPPNSIWGIRLRKAPVVSKVNVNHKRKDVLLPLTNNGKPKTIGITSKHMKLEKVGIRLFTQPRKILVTNYIGRKKTRKYVTCMLSVFDESEDPAKSPTVMRLEIMHPESGEMFNKCTSWAVGIS